MFGNAAKMSVLRAKSFSAPTKWLAKGRHSGYNAKKAMKGPYLRIHPTERAGSGWKPVRECAQTFIRELLR